jgi:hypothetical protein
MILAVAFDTELELASDPTAFGILIAFSLFDRLVSTSA